MPDYPVEATTRPVAKLLNEAAHARCTSRMRRFSLIASSREHLKQAGQSYFEHLGFALLVAGLLLSAAVACFIDALLPGTCRTSASQLVALLTRLFSERHQLRATARAASGPLVLKALFLLSIPPLLDV